MEDLSKWHANQGRKQRVIRYRQLCNLDEDFQITEENLDPYGVRYISCHWNIPEERIKSELLGQKWSDLEEE